MVILEKQIIKGAMAVDPVCTKFLAEHLLQQAKGGRGQNLVDITFELAEEVMGPDIL